MDFVRERVLVPLVFILMEHSVKNVQIIAIFVNQKLSVSYVLMVSQFKFSVYQVKISKFVVKFVETVENLRLNVMMEIQMKVMDVLLLARLMRVGHVLVVQLLSLAPAYN